MKTPIIIVGMARSGTTLASHLLGSSQDVYSEIEPHILWKCGSFSSLGDDQYTHNVSCIKWIREKLLSNAQSKVLVEKSPPNCIRPNLVHSVFPDAKIVYVERDPVRCIDSNFKRSISNDSLKFSIILKKYLISSGSSDLAGAIGKRKLHQQLRVRDVPLFVIYFLRMLFLRGVSKTLPFGPKLSDYGKYVKKNGVLSYHVKVFVEASKCKAKFQSLYGSNFKVFTLERFQSDLEEVKIMYAFCGLPVDEYAITLAAKSISKERVKNAVQKGPHDDEIEQLLTELLQKEKSGV
ncbi:MAG: sulfotransferase [Zetaproteobacteria bacterium]|nr:sulfotransferase [Zetaproteobacteria bacterium]